MMLILRGHGFAYETECVVRLFYPGEKIRVTTEETDDPEIIAAILERREDGLALRASVHLDDFARTIETTLPLAADEKTQERTLAALLFGLLTEKTGQRPPWGILTGVRPVRFCRVMGERGLSEGDIFRILSEDYLVQPEKIRLALETGRSQAEILAGNQPGDYSLYISIPFCPSRCLYCSFVSHEIEKCRSLIPAYVEKLCAELRATAAIAGDVGWRLRTVYMGGGTPTTLEASDLDRILGVVGEHFDLSGLAEYTVEAGRPDTVTPEKLAVLRRRGVGRISVNPQTMEDSVLTQIGRRHTARQVEESFALARQAGFDWINMDLIAGLPGDSDTGFSRTLEKVLALSPENITLHTLTVKRSSTLRGMESAYEDSPMHLEQCLAQARQTLEQAGYRPYYLYRQKGTRQNLENVGYTKPGFASPYNIFTMEEVQTILAVGAGAVTKLCGAEKTVRRICNHKYPYEYINRFGELLERKAAIADFPAASRRGVV
jgi:oxygen-independent coproporphyrinogen-3 oxidase